MEKHPSGQAVSNAVGGKRKRDDDGGGTCLAPAAKRKRGGGDGKYPALSARRIESDGERECLVPPSNSKRAARHEVAYKKELSPVAMYGADDDPCKDVIICASTVNEQQTSHSTKHRIGLSTALDPEFLGNVDPTLLALWQLASTVHSTTAMLSDLSLQTLEALRRPRRRRSRFHS